MNGEAPPERELRMIQALFAGAATAGEKAAAGAPPAERIRARLREAEKREEAVEHMQQSLAHLLERHQTGHNPG